MACDFHRGLGGRGFDTAEQMKEDHGGLEKSHLLWHTRKVLKHETDGNAVWNGEEGLENKNPNLGGKEVGAQFHIKGYLNTLKYRYVQEISRQYR